jgi:hypothetical protein
MTRAIVWTLAGREVGEPDLVPFFRKFAGASWHAHFSSRLRTFSLLIVVCGLKALLELSK